MKKVIHPNVSFRFLITLIISGFLALNSSAQRVDLSNLLFEYLTLENGLPNNKVNAVTNDKNGFMWFGTNEGICRYDGFNFKYYLLDKLTGNETRTSQISVIKKDTKGNMLIGAYALFRYNYTLDRIERCDSSNGLDLTGRVYAIEEGKDGKIWIGTERGLFSYNADINVITPCPSNYETNYRIISLLYDEDKLWFGTRNGGLLVFDIKSNSYLRVPKFSTSTETRDQVNCLYKDKKNIIWAGTQDNGILKFNPLDSSLVRVYPDIGNNLSYRIRKIINDKYGNIWIGCRLGIFFQKDGTDSLILVKQLDPLTSRSRSNSIYDIFFDQNEIMWTGSFSFGVSYADFRRKPFHLFNISDEETMANVRMVNCFTDGDDGNIWIGTEENGLFRYNRRTSGVRQFKPDTENRNSVAGENVKTLARESNGDIWIGYYSSGLDYMNVKTGKFVNYRNDIKSATSIISNNLHALIHDDNDNLWIATNKGVDFLENGSTTFHHTNLKIEVLTLYMDKNKRIWAGTTGDGIYRYNDAKQEFEKVYSAYFSSTIKAIHIDSRNNLWVGTNKGLYYIDSRTDSLIYTGTEKGLPSNAILDILEDNSKNLWVSTSSSLIKCEEAILNPETFLINQYSSHDGLQGEHFRESAIFKNNAGEFYLGGIQGFNIFMPDSIKNNPFPPKLAFTKLKIFNKDVEIGEKIKGRTVLEKSLNETDQLTLSYKHSPVSFEFVALHFSNPADNRYRFKLSPLEEEWNYSTGIRNFASYSNLHGGEYSFVAEAANSDGLWNPEPLVLKIRVIPPFWKTWWFIGIIISLVSASAFGYYRYRISLLKRYSSELEKKVEDRTHKLKESLEEVIEKQNLIEEQSKVLVNQKEQLQELNSTKDKFFSIMAHDLRNPFQSLLGFSELLVEDPGVTENSEQKKYAQAIYNSSRNLYSLVENLLTWAGTQTNKISFVPQEIDIISEITGIISLLEPNFNQKNITLGKEFNSDRKGYADKNMIELVIRNLISNAIKFTPENGKIFLSVSENMNFLQLEIRDNGVGISKEDQEKLFRIDSNFRKTGTGGENGTGLGLIICKEFIEKNGGKIWVKSQPGEGSSFYFTIPCSG